MKTCSKCNLDLPKTEFPKHAGGRDGLKTWCLACNNARYREWGRKNRDKKNSYSRDYYAANSEKIKAQHKDRYARRAEEMRGKAREAYDPIKSGARNAIHAAVSSGSINVPAICSQCGTRCRPDGHHEDYSKPMDVVWLCRSCHRRLHANILAKRTPAEGKGNE